jgi:hypothetical protein
MEISSLNGSSIGVVEINNYIRVRTSKKITTKNIKLQLNRILKGIDYKHSIYTLDIGKEDNTYQYNILIQSNELNLSNKLQKNITGAGDIVKEKGKILVTKSISTITKGKKDIKRVSEWRFVDGENINGKSIDIRIEPIIDRHSASYYIDRYTNKNYKSYFIIPSIIY